MKLLTQTLRRRLEHNWRARQRAEREGCAPPDPRPEVRLFSPVGSATWLATEIDEDDVLFGLADLGFGCPELGSFSLAELEAVRLPFGLAIERDRAFTASHPLSCYALAARKAGSILAGERLLQASCTGEGERTPAARQPD